MSEVTTEYGLLMSSGGFLIRNTDPMVEQIYPTPEWARNETFTGGHVYRRRIVIQEEWEEITDPAREWPADD